MFFVYKKLLQRRKLNSMFHYFQVDMATVDSNMTEVDPLSGGDVADALGRPK
jgi:hypothetical protein